MRHVVVVNEAFARENFPGQDALGQRVTIEMKDENPPSEIIGIVGDNKHKSLDSEVEPMAFWPHAELVYPSMTIAIRTRGESTNVAAAARDVIHQLAQGALDAAQFEEMLQMIWIGGVKHGAESR